MIIRIYGLVNSLTHRVFYIGQSRQPLGMRLIQTMYEWRNSKGGRRKHQAISRINEAGGEVLIVELDQAMTQLEADRLEKSHIAYSKAKGYNLANTSQGGAGNWGVKRTRENRNQIAASVAAYHRNRRTQPS